MYKKSFLIVLVLILSIFVLSCRRAPNEAINLNGFTLNLSTPQIEFPTAITFNLEAESSTPITKIKFQYQIDKLSSIPVTSVAFPEFESARKVKTSWTWNMRHIGGLPPGTEVKYWWLLENAEGKTVETSLSTVRFADSRYSWKSSTYSKVNLFWYKGDPSFAQELLQAAQEALQRLAVDTGVQLERVARIYIYASTADLQGAMVYPQEWTGGVAFSAHSIIALGIAPGNLDWGKRAIAHELAHLVIYQKTFSCSETILPTWLEEGLAMYAEGELTAEFRLVLDQAIQQDALISVRTLSSPFPAQRQQALLSYAESFSIVDFLIQTSGKDKILELLEVFQQGSGYDEALQQVYGFDLDGLDARWRAFVKGEDYIFATWGQN